MKEGIEFSKFSKKGGGVYIFPIKKERLVKQVSIFFKKGGVPLIFLLTNPFQCYLSLSVWCVYVLLIYIIAISITCVSQEEPNP